MVTTHNSFKKFNCESGERNSLVAGERCEVQGFSLRKSQIIRDLAKELRANGQECSSVAKSLTHNEAEGPGYR